MSAGGSVRLTTCAGGTVVTVAAESVDEVTGDTWGVPPSPRVTSRLAGMVSTEDVP